MLFRAMLTEFEHVTEHGDSPTSARQFRKGLQRRRHGCRIGVIGVIDNSDVVPFVKFHAHSKRPSVSESATNGREIHTSAQGQGRGAKCVIDIVLTEIMELHVTAAATGV